MGLVNIVWMLGEGYKIYHIKQENRVEYEILTIDKIRFETVEEAQVYCDMMGYKVLEVIDLKKSLDAVNNEFNNSKFTVQL